MLSGNSAKLVSKVRVLSGIKVYVNITFGTSDNEGGGDPHRADSLFSTLDRDGDGKLSPEEFRRSPQASASPAKF